MLEEDLFAYMNDSDEEEPRHNYNSEDEFIDNANEDHFVDKDDLDNNINVEFHRNAVTALNQCPTLKARKLCLFNLDYKLQHSDHYDIGGTYTKQNPNLWFYCTTTVCPGGNYLLNIFVCHRNTGSFKISISDIDTHIQMKDVTVYSKYLLLPNKLISKTFRSSQADKNHYIKSFCFTKEVVDNLHKTLSIPIEIELKPKCPVDKDFLRNIKLKHCLSGMFNRQVNTDFILESRSGKKFNVHKILLATHSIVLKEIIKKSESNCAVVDMSDEEIEALLEYLYSVSEKSFVDENCFKLLDVAYRFKLENLIPLKQSEIIQKLTVKNAIEVAVLTEKYKLESIQKIVFEFIKKNPEVLETEGWKNLNDVALTKKLFNICKQS
ncbi:uncharacterized protein LOC124540439 [Vanessa cardui]|uniref:uncharacterized protein LOC124540439 n=1 Tax=Vanessa cardui TaxID=171605 RepID=UPI001F1368C7|nr:uncharacterized protein LOC124540439 [Vanessa cardui]